MVSGACRALALSSLFVVFLASGCVYPRRSTSLSPVSGTAGGVAIGVPADVVSLTIISARPNPTGHGGYGWDENHSPPDCFVRVYRDDEMVFESETIDDSVAPEWNVTLPENFIVSRAARVRLEIWDRDPIGADPVGIWRGVGLPESANTGVEANILLEGNSTLRIRVGTPRAHRGIGIRSFELRPGELVVLEVEAYSPAGRAGIVPGDRIIAIGGHEVGDLSPNAATGALSMSADRHEALRLRNERGEERVIELDRGYTYLVE